MQSGTTETMLSKIEELQHRLAESEQLIEAIKAGEVDAFAVNENNKSEVYTLQSGDYAYRLLIEEFGEGAVNLTEDGLIVYSNTYFAELLKLPYEKVVGSFFTDFIEADSKETFKTLFAGALSGRSKGEINLTVGDNLVPVYISLTSLRPKLATIGIIITDYTEKKKHEEVILKYQRDLELKNIELEQSNIELNSFTYIASHDLQEPLRKIQTFCNRLIENEYASFNTSTKDYFERINAASKRMQNLITSLLNYSLTSTAQITYTLTDLNQVLKEVMNNLREMIEDNDVTIEVSTLPALAVIPHQLNQLFYNLISNAIKYRKRGAAAVIKISAALIQVSDFPSGQAFPGDAYWRISVADNGIGFDQQYADRIFELFQRLHPRAEYEGTGIGLAICKKIVQNHQGFIKATGQKGVGSTIDIYLPQRVPEPV
ncbi:MAG: ATP-binding protein [Bacteroidota bacterium]|nr:ATP-binding protein [Bacteroidota bacterium]